MNTACDIALEHSIRRLFATPGSWLRRGLHGLLLLLALHTSAAAIIGTNVPATPVTRGRIAALTATERPAWEEYLKRSELQRRTDQLALQTEMVARGLSQSLAAPAGSGTQSIPGGSRTGWHAGAEAGRIADIIVSFQTPAGGWSKNLDCSTHAREPGQSFSPDTTARFIGTNDYGALDRQRWNYVGTIDNDATTTQLRFLAKVITAGGSNAVYQRSFERGIDYLLAAQNPNGGWPQVWPLQGDYHDAITYNDGAMVHVMELLQDIGDGTGDFEFVANDQRQSARAAFRRGLDCILASQIIVGGRLTVWCQQHDALTLAPTSARNYEMPALCSAESAGILDLLMRLPAPDSNVVAAVRAAAAWLEKTRMPDVAFREVGDKGRLLVPGPGNGPLWARYREIGTDRPVFGDRDKSIHDAVDGISRERRDGYAWFNSSPRDVLRRFANWNPDR